MKENRIRLKYVHEFRPMGNYELRSGVNERPPYI